MEVIQPSPLNSQAAICKTLLAWPLHVILEMESWVKGECPEAEPGWRNQVPWPLGSAIWKPNKVRETVVESSWEGKSVSAACRQAHWERKETGRSPAINMQGFLGRAAVSCVVITWHISSSVCITAVIPGHQCNLSLSLIFTAWKGSTSEVQLLQYYNSANWTRIKNIPKVTQRRRATKESNPGSVRHHSMGSVLSPVETKTGLLHQMNSKQFSSFPKSVCIGGRTQWF